MFVKGSKQVALGVLCPLSLSLQCQNKEGSEVANAMAKKKLKNSKNASSVVGRNARQKEMKQLEKYDFFPLGVIALVVAVCVVPLTAELSVCK